VKIYVAVGTLDPQRLWVRCAVGVQIGVVVLEDIRTIIRKSQTSRETAAIVSRTDVPRVRGLPQQGWFVCPARHTVGLRVRVSIVCGNAEAAQQTRKKGEVLLVGDFEAV